MQKENPFPFIMRDLTDQEKGIIAWDPSKERVKFIGNRAAASPRIRTLGKEFYNFEPRADDVWLVGFPRSGTTLTQEILYLIGSDMNYEKAANSLMDIRFPVLQAGLERNYEDADLYDTCPQKHELLPPPHKLLEQTKEKRFMKSHFGFSMLHPELLDTGCKVVFIARNIKDVMVSYYRFPDFSKIPDFRFNEMWKCFKHDLPPFGNYFEMLEEAWQRRDNPNLLMLFYEEVNADKRAAIAKIAKFLGRDITNDELQKLLEHLKIENFRTNKSLNNDYKVDIGVFGKNDQYSFIRQGKSGGWKEVIPQELVPEIDEWILKNLKAIPKFEIPHFWMDVMDLKLK